MHKKKNWIFFFIRERLSDVVSYILTIIVFTIVIGFVFKGLDAIFGNLDYLIETFFYSNNFFITFILIVPIIMKIISYRYIRVKMHAMMKSKFYRLPQLSCEGIIVEIKVDKSRFFDPSEPQWVLIETTDFQQIKAYLPYKADNKFQFAPGETGTMYYRKSKKLINFEDFIRDDPMTGEPTVNHL